MLLVVAEPGDRAGTRPIRRFEVGAVCRRPLSRKPPSRRQSGALFARRGTHALTLLPNIVFTLLGPQRQLVYVQLLLCPSLSAPLSWFIGRFNVALRCFGRLLMPTAAPRQNMLEQDLA
jgi:hypothetical protein